MRHKKEEVSSSKVVFVVVVLLSVASLVFIYDNYRDTQDVFQIELEADYKGDRVGGKVAFPPSTYELLQSSGPMSAKCEVGEHPIDLWLWKNGRRNRHLQFCPSDFTFTRIEPNMYVPPTE